MIHCSIQEKTYLQNMSKISAFFTRSPSVNNKTIGFFSYLTGVIIFVFTISNLLSYYSPPSHCSPSECGIGEAVAVILFGPFILIGLIIVFLRLDVILSKTKITPSFYLIAMFPAGMLATVAVTLVLVVLAWFFNNIVFSSF